MLSAYDIISMIYASRIKKADIISYRVKRCISYRLKNLSSALKQPSAKPKAVLSFCFRYSEKQIFFIMTIR